jgi:hypothetical protein
MSVLRAGRLLPLGITPVLISVRGRVYAVAVTRLKGPDE